MTKESIQLYFELLCPIFLVKICNLRGIALVEMTLLLCIGIIEASSSKAVFAHLPTQVVCRQWLKKKYSFVRSANHEMQ